MNKITINILLVTGMLFAGNLFSQENLPDYLQMMNNPEGIKFSEIQQKAEEYFADKDKGQGSGYKQWKRWEYLAERRLTPDKEVANSAAMNWQAHQEFISQYKGGEDQTKATNGVWSFIGPTTYINGNGWNPGVGFVGCIAFHPTYSSIFYIGTPAGGLWKTTNGGVDWTCLTDGMPSIGVSSIVVQPSNPQVIYILTGDGDGGDTYSIGVLKSTNGGVDWELTGLNWQVTYLRRGYKLAMHPTNSSILFAATTIGIYKTIDAGISWTKTQEGSFRDLEFKPGDPTIMYASYASLFYRSTNSGDTWTLINESEGVPANAVRMAIGVSPDNPNYVYLLCGPSTGVGSFVGVYRSFDSGLSFSLKADSPNILGYSSVGNDDYDQAGYDLAIAVSRTDEADIMTGGINTWVSNDWGTNWAITSWHKTVGNDIGYTHADIHALEINPLNNYLYCGSDGGIFRSEDFGNTWSDLSSGMGNTQWYRIAGTESNSNLIIGGTQDNGCNIWTGAAYMEHVLGGDGMDCMIDHSNSNILYNSQQDGDLNKSTNGGDTYVGIQPAGSTGSWVTPFIMNPSNSNVIYGGYSNVMKSIDGGSTWSDKGIDGRGAMAMGTNNTSRIYSSYLGLLWMSNTAGDTWQSITPGLPGETITYIAVNPDNSPDVFVTFGGYNAGQKVYRSTDAGTSWTNISGMLPNVPVNCIVYEDKNGSPNDALYIGTDIGVFYRDDNIGDWIPFMNGLPTVRVFDLEINYTNGIIRAATHGRGLWSSALFSSCPAGYGLTQANDPSNPNYTGYQFYEASNSISSSRVITGGPGTDVTYKSGVKVTLLQGFHAKSGNLFKALLGPCNAAKSLETEVVEEELPGEKPE